MVSKQVKRKTFHCKLNPISSLQNITFYFLPKTNIKLDVNDGVSLIGNVEMARLHVNPYEIRIKEERVITPFCSCAKENVIFISYIITILSSKAVFRICNISD